MPTVENREFRQVLAGVRDKEILIPRLRAYWFNPKLPFVSIPTRSFDQRLPDGWFHPSEHPTWPERMLYYYLAFPNKMVPEPAEMNKVLAVTQGIFWHYFTQSCLEDMALLRVVNPRGRNAWDRVEKYVEDKRLFSRGSMDGVVNSDNISTLPSDEGFEFKTMSVAKMSGCPQGPQTTRTGSYGGRTRTPSTTPRTKSTCVCPGCTLCVCLSWASNPLSR